ncbi:hypothetical protein L7F22_020385 [Adiantum nelumboides]|nr:hypothetical protein [Adiantum nelumboides]
MTPFKLVYGLEAVVPMEFVVPSLRVSAQKMSLALSVKHRCKYLMQLEEDRLVSFYITEIIRRRRQAWVAVNVKFKIFKVGDWVMLYNSRLGPFPGKLTLRYKGPYQIVQDLGQGTFIVADVFRIKVDKPVNGFRLKKFQAMPKPKASFVMTPSPEEEQGDVCKLHPCQKGVVLRVDVSDPEDKIELLAEEEVAPMSSRDLNLVRQQLVEGMHDVWKAMRERLTSVVKYPYEAVRAGFISSHEAGLLETVEHLQKEKQNDEEVQKLNAEALAMATEGQQHIAVVADIEEEVERRVQEAQKAAFGSSCSSRSPPVSPLVDQPSPSPPQIPSSPKDTQVEEPSSTQHQLPLVEKQQIITHPEQPEIVLPKISIIELPMTRLDKKKAPKVVIAPQKDMFVSQPSEHFILEQLEVPILSPSSSSSDKSYEILKLETGDLEIHVVCDSKDDKVLTAQEQVEAAIEIQMPIETNNVKEKESVAEKMFDTKEDVKGENLDRSGLYHHPQAPLTRQNKHTMDDKKGAPPSQYGRLGRNTQ